MGGPDLRRARGLKIGCPRPPRHRAWCGIGCDWPMPYGESANGDRPSSCGRHVVSSGGRPCCRARLSHADSRPRTTRSFRRRTPRPIIDTRSTSPSGWSDRFTNRHPDRRISWSRACCPAISSDSSTGSRPPAVRSGSSPSRKSRRLSGPVAKRCCRRGGPRGPVGVCHFWPFRPSSLCRAMC